MSLSGEQNRISGFCFFQCESYRPPSVRLNKKLSAAVRSREYILYYFFRGLCSRIIRGHNDNIRISASGTAHQRSFKTIPVAAAAEQGNKPAFAGIPECAEHLFKTIRSVGIVDYDISRRGAIHSLKPAADSLRHCERTPDILRRHSHFESTHGRRHSVIYRENSRRIKA